MRTERNGHTQESARDVVATPWLDMIRKADVEALKALRDEISDEIEGREWAARWEAHTQTTFAELR